jgi:hypothetical protein
MEETKLFRACPFPPGIEKPDPVYRSKRHNRAFLSKSLNLRNSILVFTLVAGMFLYAYSFDSINTTGIPVLFRENYIVLLGVYSYLSSMISWYIKKYKEERKNHRKN